jgi:hypothetical protein
MIWLGWGVLQECRLTRWSRGNSVGKCGREVRVRFPRGVAMSWPTEGFTQPPKVGCHSGSIGRGMKLIICPYLYALQCLMLRYCRFQVCLVTWDVIFDVFIICKSVLVCGTRFSNRSNREPPFGVTGCRVALLIINSGRRSHKTGV